MVHPNIRFGVVGPKRARFGQLVDQLPNVFDRRELSPFVAIRYSPLLNRQSWYAQAAAASCAWHFGPERFTGFEGEDEAKKKFAEHAPVGLKVSFNWTVKGDAAELDDLAGDGVETLKSHLEGDFEQTM